MERGRAIRISRVSIWIGLIVAVDRHHDRALRDALVNAVAHRNYQDKTRKISVQVFSDRIVIASPGYESTTDLAESTTVGPSA